VNPETFQQDPSLRSLIDIVEFGLPDPRPPSVLRGTQPPRRRAGRVRLGAHSRPRRSAAPSPGSRPW
jgi:hypothetical protein